MPKLLLKENFAAILLDFPRTCRSDSFKDKVLMPFFKTYLPKYLSKSWGDGETMDIIRQLRLEAISTHEKDPSCPLIAEATSIKQIIIHSVAANIQWHLVKNTDSAGIRRIRSAIWSEGFGKGMIKTLLYDDVKEAFNYWKRNGVQLLTFSSNPVYEQKMLLTYSQFGNLSNVNIELVLI